MTRAVRCWLRATPGRAVPTRQRCRLIFNVSAGRYAVVGGQIFFERESYSFGNPIVDDSPTNHLARSWHSRAVHEQVKQPNPIALIRGVPLLKRPTCELGEGRLFACLCVLSLLLTACGGGGGGTPTPAPPPIVFPRASPSVTIPSDDTGYADRKSAAAAFQEYGGVYIARNGDITVFGEKYWLGAINADAAYARGATGAGETIAVFDTGIRETHREFSGKKVDVETLPRDSMTPYTPTDAQKFHGTYVAGLAAANRGESSGGNGLDMHGVAFDADLHFTQIELGNPPPSMGFQYTP